jgi:hypothetical protein
MMRLYDWFASRAELAEEVEFHSGFLKSIAKPFYLATRGLAEVSSTICSEPCDSDGDGVPDDDDNCPNTPNPFQEDTYPPQGNGIGDACDCECDFDCDGDVDADDVASFLTDFGRSVLLHPCSNTDPCNGDSNCDSNVDAPDVEKFLEDFGRFQFNNPCPACVVGDWCVY